MSFDIWNEEDQFEAEDRVERAVVYLRHTEAGKKSPHKTDCCVKTVKKEIQFLRDNFPDSYVLKQDFSDIKELNHG